MEHRTLARTGVHVSPLCLGAMMFGAWGETDHDECDPDHPPRARRGDQLHRHRRRLLRAASRRTIVGKALAGGRRDDVVLATKFHGTMGDDANQAGNSRRWIFREVEASLERLGTDWIDLYQVHRWDPWTDHEETLGALSDLVAQGKVRYVGSSTYPAAQIVKAQWVARERGLQRFVCEQPPYSLLARGIEADVLPDLPRARHGRDPLEPARRRLAVGPVAQGRRRPDVAARGDDPPALRPLASRPTRPSSTPPTRSASSPTRRGMSLIDMALAFVIRHPAVTAAIIGPRTMEQLESQLGAADVQLDDALLDRIDEIVAARHDDQPDRRRMDEPGAGAGRPPSVKQVPRSLTIRPSRSGGARKPPVGVASSESHERQPVPLSRDWAYRNT